MDEHLLKLLLQGGAAGVVIVLLWPLVNKYMNYALLQMEKRIKEAEKRTTSAEARVAAAEKRLDACEEDREKLHKEIADVLLKLANLS